MRDAKPAERPDSPLAVAGKLLPALLLLATLAAGAGAAPQTTSFVHSVGFSFDYPSKWTLKRVVEGLMLVPSSADRDASGRPRELVIVGFVDTGGVTDPFDPLFPDAFEERYREIVPVLRRAGDLDWLQTPMGTGLVLPFEDARGNEHRLYCAVHGDLGLFLSHVVQGHGVRPSTAKVEKIFSSFGWNESVIDPVLVRSWTEAGEPAAAAQAPAERWTFKTDGRLRRGAHRRGFYSSFDGVLNIVWDHGIEESYLYTVSNGAGGASLELKHPDGGELRLH